jgi:hypothetical protein
VGTLFDPMLQCYPRRINLSCLLCPCFSFLQKSAPRSHLTMRRIRKSEAYPARGHQTPVTPLPLPALPYLGPVPLPRLLLSRALRWRHLGMNADSLFSLWVHCYRWMIRPTQMEAGRITHPVRLRRPEEVRLMCLPPLRNATALLQMTCRSWQWDWLLGAVAVAAMALNPHGVVCEPMEAWAGGCFPPPPLPPPRLQGLSTLPVWCESRVPPHCSRASLQPSQHSVGITRREEEEGLLLLLLISR